MSNGSVNSSADDQPALVPSIVVSHRWTAPGNAINLMKRRNDLCVKKRQNGVCRVFCSFLVTDHAALSSTVLKKNSSCTEKDSVFLSPSVSL